MIGIYRIKNITNGMSYIGQSINIEKRLAKHRTAPFNPNDDNYNSPLYTAIREDGLSNFEFSVLEECESYQLNEKEIEYIFKFNSYGDRGYNRSRGGAGSGHFLRLSEEKVLCIMSRLNTSMDSSEAIGDEFGVSGRTIRSINSGDEFRIDGVTYPIRPPLFKNGTTNATLSANKLFFRKRCVQCGTPITKTAEYCSSCWHKNNRKVADPPDAETIAKMIHETGSFEGIAKALGVSSNSIRKWLKNAEIPHTKSELLKWYEKNVNDEVGA